MIFAADIGGTNARLGLFERSGARLGAIATKTYPSRQHASLEEIVERFISSGKVGCDHCSKAWLSASS